MVEIPHLGEIPQGGCFEIVQKFVVEAAPNKAQDQAPMAITREKLASCDPVWAQLRSEAEVMAEREPALAGFVHGAILTHERLEDALSYHMARKLGGDDLSPLAVRETFEQAIAAEPDIGAAFRADLSAVMERDPACHSFAEA